MHLFKRTWLSLIRRKKRTLLLLLIIFILGSVMAGAIAIRLATENVETNIRRSLGMVMSITYDYDTLEEMEKSGELEDGYPDPLSPELLRQIGSLPYVKAYDINAYRAVGSDQLQQWQPEGVEVYHSDLYYAFNLHGTDYAQNLLLSEGVARLVEGRSFEQSEIDQGASVAMIFKPFAEVNELHIGDDIVMNYSIVDYSATGSEILEVIPVPLKIIGIMEPILPEGQSSSYGISDREFNAVTVPNRVMEQMVEESKQIIISRELELDADAMQVYTTLHYNNKYILKDPQDADKFIAEAQAILPELFVIEHNQKSLSLISGSLEQTTKIAEKILYATFGAAILIIGLVVVLFLRERKHELGIYMSLGESRIKIVSQIVLEVLLIAGLAIALSLLSGKFISEGLSNSMVRDQLVEQTEYIVDRGDVISDQYQFGLFYPELTSDNVVANYQIDFSSTYIGWLLAAGMGAALIASILPTAYILRLSPRQVMM